MGFPLYFLTISTKCECKILVERNGHGKPENCHEKVMRKTFAKSVGTLSQICIVSIMSEETRRPCPTYGCKPTAAPGPFGVCMEFNHDVVFFTSEIFHCS